MIKETREKMEFFLKQKKYFYLLLITALFSYGFMIVHPTIGIDDTSTMRYFTDGVSPVAGRWCIFLINKVFHIAEFAPFVTEVASIIILVLSVTLWCVVFARVLENRVGIMGYAIFASLFLSAPVLSEVYTYYLHNGISIAYGVTAFAVLLFLYAMECEASWKYILGSGIALTVAVGFYESMLVVYVIGVIMVYLLIWITGRQKEYKTNVIRWIISGIITAAFTLVLRSLIRNAMIVIFGLQDQIGVLPVRSMGEISQWFDGTSTLSDFFMLLKRFWLMYYVNAIVYFPVTMFVLAAVILVCYGVYKAIRKRNLWILVCVAGILGGPWIMLVIEGYTTHYRASQYIPPVCGFAALLIAYEINAISKVKIRRIACVAGNLLGVIFIYNQASEMNKCFYVDYLKYEDARNTMNSIAWELEAHYDTGKPVIIRGSYEVPYGIVKDVYVDAGTWQYQLIKSIVDPIDPHLMEKYYSQSGYGYFFSETPLISVIDWGVNAFDDTNVEFFKFWEMHGHSFVMETDLEKYEEAQQKMTELQMPSWPEEGYIVELEEYIIVNLG